ncbi:MAG TPA: VWA domain-containing protein [Bryobacteraceae bacterium]|jgi:VWFA-related protein
MKKYTARVVLFLLAIALAASGQPSKPAPKDDDIPVFKAGKQLVNLYASVLDSKGKLVSDLPKSAFKVFENGVEQQVSLFRSEDVPVSMGILIDNSGSMKEKREKVAEAALDLVKASNPQDEVFIESFNDKWYLDQDFTSDIQKLEAALDKLETRGSTALYDAIHLGVEHAKKGKRDKKVLLVVTDGNDTDSDETLEQIVREARQSDGVLIYSIGILSDDTPHDTKSAKRALKALAEASGGLDYYPKSLNEIDQIIPQVAREIRHQYLLAYTPLNDALDGTFRQIKVSVTGPGKPTARARNGYYASPSEKAAQKPAEKSAEPPKK